MTFEATGNFKDSTQVTISEVTFHVAGGPEKTIARRLAVFTSKRDLPGDFDRSGRVDLDDFFEFANAFGSTEQRFDLDNSGHVDLDDFFEFASNFGKERKASNQVSIAPAKVTRSASADNPSLHVPTSEDVD